MGYTNLPNYQEIDQSLEKITEGIPPQLVNYLRLHFQKNISEVLGKTVEMDLKLVVDTSSILPELISFVRNGKSALYEVSQGAFLSLYAPSKLVEEVEKKIPEISKRNRLDKDRLIQAWRESFRPRIIIANIENLQAIIFGLATVRKRDIEDVPFVALNFSLKTHGIVTRDKDIIEQPEIRTWSVGKVKKLVTIFGKGTFSFFISSKLLLPLLRAVFQIGVSVLRSLLEFAGELVQLSINLIKGLIDRISRLPDWAKILLGVSVIVMFSIEETRKTALELLQKIGEAISTFISQMYNLIKGLLEKIAPYIEFTIVMTSVLLINMQQAITQLQSLQIS